ncbi:MAG TPA: helix-turn-helix domain-containing protein, partial [Dehalococcoidia bacterium]|nr:helix-turn-helix domain-containing protein [Dehalococcoidia bacterium]
MTQQKAILTISIVDRNDGFAKFDKNSTGFVMVEDTRVTPPAGETWLSIREASRLLGVSSSTLRRWSDRKLIAVSVTPGGHRRYTRASIEELRQRLGSLP